METKIIQDVQSRPDTRDVRLEKAGISGVKLPGLIMVRNDTKAQSIMVEWALSTSLNGATKGVHMSRFIEDVLDSGGVLSIADISTMSELIRNRQESSSSQIKANFPYYVNSTSPVSGKSCPFYVDVEFNVVNTHSSVIPILRVTTPVMTLCPCSKEISEYGAHNQRSLVTISVELRGTATLGEIVWIEELVEIAQNASSCPVYPILKRPDEKFVTEASYDNPKFAEDVVRDATLALRKLERRISWFKVSAENQESIHDHQAYAETEEQL